MEKGGSVGYFQEAARPQTTKEEFKEDFKRRATSLMDCLLCSKAQEKVVTGMDERAAGGSPGSGTGAGGQGERSGDWSAIRPNHPHRCAECAG